LLNPEILKRIPKDRKRQIVEAIKELTDPKTGANKKEIKGSRRCIWRLRIGDYRVFYEIAEEQKTVYIFDILTAEQAHKKYGQF
jgi:mRNA-degrading endonuclease RelE of RelBE toxin-antitoxin system